MTNEQIQALKTAAEKALPAMQRLLMMPNDELFDEALLNADGDVDLANEFNLLAGPETILSLLAEREADKALIAEQTKYIERLREWNAGLAQESLDHQQRIADTDDALCKLLPGVQYMDPPDGGCVTPLEHVSRMVADYRQQITELEGREITVTLPGDEIGEAREFFEEVRVLPMDILSVTCAAAGITLKVGGE